ncbi:hypothetical protein D3C78_785690 [compost metagenome]
MLFTESFGSFVHFLMHLVQHSLNFFYQLSLFNDLLLSTNTGDKHTYAILHIARSDLKSYRNASHFILIKFPAWTYIRTIIDTDANTCLFQLSKQFIRFAYYCISCFRRSNWNDHHLLWSYFRRKSKPAIITMHHD